MIYLIQGYGNVGKLLKIGYTNNLDFRLSMFKTDTPNFELISTREGSVEFEHKLQKYFSNLNFIQNTGGREWFIYDERIIREFDTIQEDNLIIKEDLIKKLDPILDITNLVSQKLDNTVNSYLKDSKGDSSFSKCKIDINRFWKSNSILMFPKDCPDALDKTKTSIVIGNNSYNLSQLFNNSTHSEIMNEPEIKIDLCSNLPNNDLEKLAFNEVCLYYLDRFNKSGEIYGREDYIRKTYNEFFSKYDKIEIRPNKLKFLCEYCSAGNDITEILEAIHEKRFSEFITVLGPDVCRACGYNVTKLYKRLDIISFDPSKLKERILSEFEVGNRYSKADIKDRLSRVYKELDYKASPKASDLNKYLEMKSCMLSEGSKRVNGFKIINKKD